MEKLRGKAPEQIDDIFNHIINTVIEQINSDLYFGGNKLVVSKNKFLIIPIGGTVRNYSTRSEKHRPGVYKKHI